MYGTVEGSDGSSYDAPAATPATDGANLDAVSPSHVRPSESVAETDAPQFMRICPAAVELSPLAAPTSKTTGRISSKMRGS
uniref:Uncharacterized protein n=1 Tax=Arundo donax TaxID=35708 RepID=A0A0A9BTW3_ARUDO